MGTPRLRLIVNPEPPPELSPPDPDEVLAILDAALARHVPPPAGAGWAMSGLCRLLPPHLFDRVFFPGRGQNTSLAKRICNGDPYRRPPCPVRDECLEFALARNDPGVWGGTSENERRTMRRSIAATTATAR